MSGEQSYEIVPAEGGAWLYTTQYNEEFVEQMKEEIPPAHRGWKEEKGAWWVNEDWLELAEDIASRHYKEG